MVEKYLTTLVPKNKLIESNTYLKRHVINGLSGSKYPIGTLMSPSNNIEDKSIEYPVFLKPDIGYGSRGTYKANNLSEVEFYKNKDKDLIILEYLPGNEFTIDCFTNFKRELLFIGPRLRNRISNGISVNTSTINVKNKFER